MVGIRRRSACNTYHYVYYQCSGHSALTVGRTTRCAAKLIRAERLDAVVWQALGQLLQTPSVIPHLHQSWATAQQQGLSGLEVQQAQLSQRQQRLERQDQRLLDAYQAEIITLSELQARRQKLAVALQQIEQERQQLAQTRQQRIHWQRVIDNAVTFRQLLGDHLDQLSFEERQAVVQCLINKVIVTGEDVDVHFILPFESTPQVSQRLLTEPEGTPGYFYRLRLAHFEMPLLSRPRPAVAQLIGIGLAKLPAPLADRFIRHDDATGEQELFHVAVAQTEAEVQPDAMADDFNGKTMMLVIIRTGWCVHEATIAHQTAVVQAAIS
jgi:hypothetical protein